MKIIRPFAYLATSLIVATSGFAYAQNTHASHQAELANASASATTSASSKSTTDTHGKNDVKEVSQKMDMKMSMMRDIHEKMMAAKTPEQRNAMMAGHKKMMQEGMAMMGEMKMMSGSGMGMKSDQSAGNTKTMMMEKRMEMMETMMQMMIDCLPEANPVPAKK